MRKMYMCPEWSTCTLAEFLARVALCEKETHGTGPGTESPTIRHSMLCMWHYGLLENNAGKGLHARIALPMGYHYPRNSTGEGQRSH